MTQPFMQYNQEAGVKAGGSGLSEGGAHICLVTEAKYKKASTGSHGIEFALDVGGLKAQFVTIYYAKASNEPIASGNNILNAMMGVLGIAGLSFQPAQSGQEQIQIIPELTGKTIGLFLQKVLYTKSDGSDGYKFDIKTPFDPKTTQTLREKVAGTQAKAIESMASSYADKDDRNAGGQNTSQGGPQGYDNDPGAYPGF